jgi:hypothetical protein
MELRQMRLFVQSEAESGKFPEVSRVLHLAVNILFHICSRKDQLNKINTFLLEIFVEMRDEKKMLLPE